MLWLVRHGESEANAGRVTTDYAAIPLTPRGRRQAEAIASSCSEAPLWVGLSPYLRARQTAKPLLARYPETVTIPLAVQEFTYLAATRAGGMDSGARRPLVDAYWARMDPNYCDGEGAESFAMLCHRANLFLQWALRQAGFGVVFTHEQFIRAVLLAAGNPDVSATALVMQRFVIARSGLAIPNGAIVRLHRQSGRWQAGDVDTAHLHHARGL